MQLDMHLHLRDRLFPYQGQMDWDSLFGHIFLFASLSLRVIPIIKGYIWEEKGDY